MKSEFDLAQEQLRVIRALMERATIYRSISALTAAVGGTLSVLASAWIWYFYSGPNSTTVAVIIAIWLAVLAVTLIVNFAQLWWGTRKRNERYFSPGFKLACWSISPFGLLFLLVTVPAVIISGAYPVDNSAQLPLGLVWSLIYGLALLSTQHFAPRSLVFLGWAFFLTPLLATGGFYFLNEAYSNNLAFLYMAGTFGGYHLIYAAVIWWRKEERAPELSLDDTQSEIPTEHV